MINWTQCDAVERDIEKVGGAWVFRGTRVPVTALFENLEGGASAEAEDFDALISTDQNLRYQQNLSGRKIAIAVLMTASWPRIRKCVATVTQIIDGLQPGSYVEIPIP